MNAEKGLAALAAIAKAMEADEIARKIAEVISGVEGPRTWRVGEDKRGKLRYFEWQQGSERWEPGVELSQSQQKKLFDVIMVKPFCDHVEFRLCGVYRLLFQSGENLLVK